MACYSRNTDIDYLSASWTQKFNYDAEIFSSLSRCQEKGGIILGKQLQRSDKK
jgi:hypothetical protein